MRKMLKMADRWNWCNTILFVFGMITCTGYLIKHLMMIIFGVKARRLLKQKNDPFDPEVQKFWFLHRHAQARVHKAIFYLKLIRPQFDRSGRAGHVMSPVEPVKVSS